MTVKVANTTVIDDSRNLVNINAAQVTGDFTVAGAFTSLGIDDNATGERVQISDAALTVGVSGTGYNIVYPVNDQVLGVSGGTDGDTGANVRFYGGTHATLANDIVFRANTTTKLQWDNSAGIWNRPDSVIDAWGDGNDLQIYHNGSNSYISDQGTGQLRILSNAFRVNNAADNESIIAADENGAVTLYYDNSAKLATTTNGVDIASDLSLGVGSITSASGAIAFGNENLSTTGTLTASGGGALTGTWSNLGTVTAIDINGGTADNLVIGGATPAAGTFTTLSATTSISTLGTLSVGVGGNGTISGESTSYITINSGLRAYASSHATKGGDVDVLSNFYIPAPTVPGSAGADGFTGQISWDANYIYVCVAGNTWKRVAIATW